jgi:hypothetical protein
VTAITFCSFSSTLRRATNFVVTFVTVVTCEMNTVTTGEAQLSHWVVGQTPAMQGLEGLRSPCSFHCEQKKIAPTS